MLRTLRFVVPILVATVPTVYGIETLHCLVALIDQSFGVQQYWLFAVCAEGCEAAEEQSDDEVRTSLA